MGKNIAYIFILLLWALSTNAIEDRYLFNKLTRDEGLSYNTVRDIAQEESGIMWFASDQGLNKYDSYNITRYYKEDNVGIPSNIITELLVTKNNHLFVGTNNGLVEYNRRFDKFEELLYKNKSLPHVRTFCETNIGTILIGTTQGIFAFYPVENKIVKLVSLQNQTVNSILQYDTNVFWVSTNSGLYILDGDGVLLYYLNKTNTASLPTNFLSKIFIDKKGQCWIGTINSGLFLFEKEKKVFTKIPLLEIEFPEARVVRDINEDLDGNIWVAGEQGIFIINATTHEVLNIRHSLEKSEYNLNDNATYSLFRSKEDIMWIGTYFGGVNYTALSNSKNFFNLYPGYGENKLPGKAVNRLFKDSENILWIATEDGGICSFDTESKNIISYFQKEDSKNSLSSNNVHSICEDGDGNLWFGHFITGIDIYNRKTGQFNNISVVQESDYTVTQNSVFCLLKDSDDDIWIGTRRGIFLYNNKTKQIASFRPNDLGSSFVYNVIQDKNGKIWFSLSNNGIASYDKQTKKLKHYLRTEGLSTTRIISATELSTGEIWFGSVDGGVNIYQPDSDKFLTLSMNDGLPNNTIYGILEAEDGNIWLSSNNGLSMYNPELKKFRNYSKNDGLAHTQFNYSSYFKDHDGTLYFGHINGLSYFKPTEILDNPIKPRLVFTHFKLENENVVVSKKGILSQPIDQTKKIVLSYTKKAFTIDFVAVNHISAGNNKFYCYLDGFEKDWTEVGNKTSVSYANLLPGKYTFHLKSENNDGVESENTKILEIRIRPPFYLSVWAFVIYLVFFTTLFLLFRKLTIDREKEKAALELERMEKEKIQELNQQRLNFYTYISHEFKTPLSIIISSIDQLFEQKRLSDDLKLRFQRLSRSSRRLSFLFNQLMDFRKIETKHAKLVLQKGDIVSFLRETCMAFSPLFDQNQVNFEFVANREEYDYWFDPDKIEKIIANLISNALKHTPVHGKIICEINFVDDVLKIDKKKLNICISNSGKGISEEEIQNLFTPFYVNYQSNEQKSGSGIGLTLVKSLVEYLHGSINVKSKLNEGTKFTIQLPLDYKGISNIKLENTNETISRSLDLESLTEYSQVRSLADNKVEKSKEFNLLIVEDTKDLAEVLIEHYAQNFNVNYAPNGVEALNVMSDVQPDIIISDVMMPEMDGIEFCKKIKENEITSHIAVILLTAKTSHEDKIAGLEAGAEAYVRKPFDLKELDLHVRNFIEVRKKLKENVVTGTDLDLDKLNFRDKDKEFIEKVSKTINENIENEALNVEELAKLLGMSKTLVYVKLKKLLNMSGFDYIQSLRFKKAIELMADTSQNISDIAYEVGYSDPNYFSKAFKKVYKQTPTAYRKELIERIKGKNIS